ncbi:MAG: hypothetical protein NVS3B5_09170 [Sphingomicrobium sp.]
MIGPDAFKWAFEATRAPQPSGLYDEDQERQAIIHARRDIVLMYSQLSSANGQLRVIKYLLAGILIAILFPLFR